MRSAWRARAAIEAQGAGWVEDHLMEVAHHYGRSANGPKAVEYLGRAGHRAAQQAAYAEAEGYLTRALDLLPQLPESAPRDRQERELGQYLVWMLSVTRGYAAPETVTATERAAALAERSGTLAQLVESVSSRWVIAFFSGDLRAASALADQALDLAAREGSPTRLAVVHGIQLHTRYWRGDLAGAEEHFTTGLAFFNDPDFRHFSGGPAVVAFGIASFTAWALGRADVARERMAQAMAAANADNPFALACAEFLAAVLRLFLGEYGHAEALAARALGRAGAIGEALATVEQALQANPDGLVERPDIRRLRGELRRTQGQTDLAAADFREAIALAQQMDAKAWELRATMSLARLLAEQGRRDEARTMLAEIYGWFTDTSAGPSAEGFGPQAGGLRSAGGFDTADLKEAKALLEELKETGC